jgi:phosphoribosylanthranilate isomerase
MNIMFTIKICGITRLQDALATAGADAVGLNFYTKSPRVITVDRAREIVAGLWSGITKVGVFVNAAPDDVCRVFDDVKLGLIQLHGDEPPEYLAQLGNRPVMKAFRTAGAEGLRAMLDYLAACRALGCLPRMVLLDSPSSQEFGGSGKLADWSLAREYQRIADLPPLVLAGGLQPNNVAEAIRATGVRSVDTASGVEWLPGLKSLPAIGEFIIAAKSALKPPHDRPFAAGQSL